MALKMDYQLSSGLIVENAYLRIDIFRGNKDKLGFNLVPYKDENSSLPLEEGRYFEFTVSQDENSLRWDKQAYEYLKQLPEFSNAVDA